MSRAKVPRSNEIAALGMVNREPMHGYRINQIAQQMGLEHWTNLSPSSTYNTLGRLAKRGAVTVTTEREGKAPERTIYHITPKGRELLVDQLRAGLLYIGPEDRLFYICACFLDVLPAEEILPLLEGRIEKMKARIEREENRCVEGWNALPHIVLMCRAGIQHTQVEIDFCARLIDLFRERPDYFAEIGGSDDDRN